MAQRRTLTEQQVEILRWIADGCPDEVMEGTFHRISAGALRRRGFVTTSGRGPTWSAKPTAAGRAYLAEVDGPNPPIPREANVSLAQQLVDDVVAADGTLRVPRSDSYRYERRARLAMRQHKVPLGKQLKLSAAGDQIEIRLVEGPAATEPAELKPVAVPEIVPRYHPAARVFRGRSDRHEVSRDQLLRAARIIHALAAEAERRGWSAVAAADSTNPHRRSRWSGAKDGHLQLEVDGERFWIRLQEEGVHTRGPWEEEVSRYRHYAADAYLYGGRRPPRGSYDADATGRLKLELFHERYWIYSGRRSRWADRQSWTRESRLAHLLREVEERVIEAKRYAEAKRIEAEQQAEAEQRAAEEREREWHRLMSQARHRLIDTRRAATLLRQAEAWDQAGQIRRYCDALAATHGDNPETATWLEWARGYATRLDPLTEAPVCLTRQKRRPGRSKSTFRAVGAHMDRSTGATPCTGDSCSPCSEATNFFQRASLLLRERSLLAAGLSLRYARRSAHAWTTCSGTASNSRGFSCITYSFSMW